MKADINILIQKPEDGGGLACQVSYSSDAEREYLKTFRGKSLDLLLAGVTDYLKEQDELGKLDYIKNGE